MANFFKLLPGKRATKALVATSVVTGTILGSTVSVAENGVSGVSNAVGPLASLSKSLFTFTELRYPSSVGGDNLYTRHPYYMKFNINISEKSTYTNRLFPQTPPEPTVHSQSVSTTALQSAIRRKTRRTNQTIMLYMPDTVQWGFNHQWSGESLTQATGIAAGALLAGLGGAYKKITGTSSQEKDEGVDAMKSAAVSALSAVIGKKFGMDVSEDLAQAAMGKAVNPNEELLYKGPAFREFQFEFLFAPRNPDDAAAALNIIQTFKFHAAPELPGGDGGRYFIPPSDFDIEFYNNQELLWQLGSIGRCVLTSITVDYGASGQFAAFNDGYPSHIRVQLQFKEIDIVTKRQIAESGF